MAGSPSPSSSASSVVSEDESDKSFSDTEAFVHRVEEEGRARGPDQVSEGGWELDYIEESKITAVGEEEEERVGRSYRLKFKGYEDSEWQPENNVDALELVRCFWENVLAGQEACIRAQQALLAEMADRPDSSDEEAPSHTSNLHGLLEQQKRPHKKLNSHSFNKEFKHRKQLKPRMRERAADSDLAESDSDSSSSSDQDSSGPDDITYSIPSRLYPQLLDPHRQKTLNWDPLCGETSERTYKPRAVKIRKQMRNELCESKTRNNNRSLDIAASLSAGLEGIDLNCIYKYKVRNPELAKKTETLIEEIKLDMLKINERRNRSSMAKDTPRLKLRVICREETDANPTANTSSVAGDIPVNPTATSRPDSNQRHENHGPSRESNKSHQDLEREKSRGNGAREVQDENFCDPTHPSVPRGTPKENLTGRVELNSFKSNKQLRPLEEGFPKALCPLNLSNIHNTTAGTQQHISPPTCQSLLNKHDLHQQFSRPSSQPTLTSSNQHFSEEEDEEEEDERSIFLAANPRVKRKYTDDHNTKFVTFNQNKKNCCRKNAITLA